MQCQSNSINIYRFLKIFTDISPEEIERTYGHMQGSDLNAAKVVLANEVCRMLHGDECLKEINATAATLFGGAGDGIWGGNVESSLSSIPHVQITVTSPLQTISIVDVLVHTKLASSKGDAKRQIRSGAIRLNGEKVVSDKCHIGQSNVLLDLGIVKVSAGKRNHVGVILEVI